MIISMLFRIIFLIVWSYMETAPNFLGLDAVSEVFL